MLYTKQQIEAPLNKEERTIFLKRYLHKVLTGETKKLQLHESEFVCQAMCSLYNEQGELAHDIYEMDFCAEFLFKRLLLTYLENLDFLQPTFNGIRNLELAEIARDRKKFYQLVDLWSEKLSKGTNDPFLHEARIEYLRKLAIIGESHRQNYTGRFIYEREILRQKIASFYMYYVAKKFFKSNKLNYVFFKARESFFSINIYSYIHIISRHYIPAFHGADPEKSLNSNLKCIDPFNLPFSIRDLILDYFLHAPEDYSLMGREYMIFREREDFYIIWWKYKKLQENANHEGYEIRTLYKILLQRDIDKIDHAKFHAKDDQICYYY